MDRSNYHYYRTSCRDGIDQRAGKARKDTCADARNVWAPHGRVEQRLGYVGISNGAYFDLAVKVLYGRGYSVAGGWALPDGAGVLVLNSYKALDASDPSDFVYIGYPNAFDAFRVVCPQVNGSATRWKAEYWDGSAWVYLRVNSNKPWLFSTTSTNVFCFARPKDWEATIVRSQSAYWIRFLLTNADFDAAVSIDVNNAGTGIMAAFDIFGLHTMQFVSTKRSLVLFNATEINPNHVLYLNSEGVDFIHSITGSYVLGSVSKDEPSTIAVIPEFEEAYVAYGGKVTVHKAYPDDSDDLNAAVETRDFAVGDGADYDPGFIVQESAFPRAKYVAYFDNRLWFAGIVDDPFAVRWGAFAPYHKVLPSISREILMEDDNSPITGMRALGEHMVVSKQDSLWLMLDRGLNAFDLRLYVPKRVVAGVGCVANASFQKILGSLIFLAEDGVYDFDGTPAIHKISDRIDNIIKSIDPGYRRFAASAHWRTEGLYLLSVSTDGQATNNLTLVFDYRNEAWWIWDNIEAQHWLVDEGPHDQQTLYFGDSGGRIYELGRGDTDHGQAITSYVVTQRAEERRGRRSRLRSFEVVTINKASALTLEPLVNDEYSGQSGITGSLNLTDANEASSWHERRRHGGIKFARNFDWIQGRVTHATKNTPFKLDEVALGYRVLGGRR